MHITSSFAGKSPSHILRESYWEDGKVKKRTLANLSPFPSTSSTSSASPSSSKSRSAPTPPASNSANPASTAPQAPS